MKLISQLIYPIIYLSVLSVMRGKNMDPLILMIILGILATIFFSTIGIEFPIVWVLYIPYVFWILHLLKLAKPIYG